MIGVAVAVAVGVALSADVDVKSLDPPTDISGMWRCTSGDDAAFAQPQFDDSAWPQAVFPDGGGGLESDCAGDFMWLRRRLHIGEPLREAPIGVAVGLVDGAYEVYVDGVLVGGDGDIDARSYPPHRGAAYAVPHGVVADGVVVAVRIRTEATLR